MQEQNFFLQFFYFSPLPLNAAYFEIGSDYGRIISRLRIMSYEKWFINLVQFPFV